jgi:hypothetical protein
VETAVITKEQEFFNYFDQARHLINQQLGLRKELSSLDNNGQFWQEDTDLARVQAIESAVLGRMKEQTKAGIPADSVRVIRSDEETSFIQESMSEPARKIVDSINDSRSKLEKLNVEALAKYMSRRVLVKQLPAPNNQGTIRQVVRESGSQAEYIDVKRAKGLVTGLELNYLKPQIHNSQLSVVRHSFGRPDRFYRVEAVTPQRDRVHAPLMRNVSIEFLD